MTTRDDGSPMTPVTGLLDDFSLEITGKDTSALIEAAPLIPPGTRVHVTFLAGEDPHVRVSAARTVRELGFRPVPHLAARRLRSHAELEETLAGMAEVDATDEVFVVGGDPAVPEGPFPDSLSILTSGRLGAHGVRRVDVAGYPEGHPGIADDALDRALQDKWAALGEQGVGCAVVTQFGFDAVPVTAWIERLRARGVTCPVRVGVPGPAGVQRLLRYARRFGVRSSAGVVQKYGFSLTGLLGTAGPHRFLDDVQAALDPDSHGEVSVHFYTFGGVRTTAEWVHEFLADRGVQA